MRRSRADGDGWGLAETPLDAAPEAYDVTISGAEGVKRKLVCDTPAATYTLAQQTADFGGVSGFTFAVAQISPLLGPGHAATKAVPA